SILRLLDQQNILGRNVMVIGTSAMYAYEAAAGVFFDIPTMATRDMDILWDIRPKLILIADKDMDNTGLLGIIQKVDRSFESISSGGFRAVNCDGFMVDLIKSEPKELLSKETRQMGGPDDLKAVEIRNVQWLISSPKFSQVVIGDDGYPALLVVPDPRAFALHKLWLSEQEDREPVKKQRDHDQGLAVAQLIIQYLPQYQFNTSELRMFPKDVVQRAKEKIS
ncbi:MAG: nucleotidyltransferase domain-containing protein, partial [Thermodesulfobacteriota bacterium]|nr:nucleotidyltransferase domain-containing protein [Thermodesulfobacteriota bacterium]